ncbi:integumentary mucin C.1-like [Neocloeon triangulifer]|uniref:integumentary mucin C.1-like n=1 Tax=Neocloeon triangulifer TaxID=2078957 RepID=UPI00286F2E18|nr:integumentary mucin C.1-like [Neocloeon triangulifer]
MQTSLILAVLVAVRYSAAQSFCTPNQVTCDIHRKSYTRCPADGVFPAGENLALFHCPASTFCVDTVTTGTAPLPITPKTTVPPTTTTGTTTTTTPTSTTTPTTTTTESTTTEPAPGGRILLNFSRSRAARVARQIASNTAPPFVPPTDIPGLSPCLSLSCRAPGIVGVGYPACDVYYSCHAINAIPYVDTCPAGQHFNNRTRVCGTPALAGCDPSLTTLPSTLPSTLPTTTPTITPAPNVPTTMTLPTTAPVVPLCAGKHKIVDSTSCRSFYKCGFFNRTPRKMRCPFQLRYDAGTGRCRINVNCGSRPDN